MLQLIAVKALSVSCQWLGSDREYHLNTVARYQQDRLLYIALKLKSKVGDDVKSLLDPSQFQKAYFA